MNDPVLDRAMFRNQAPVSSYGTGITSNVASPDEAARALQMAFQPTGYAGGGQVINGVKHFQGGGENVSKGRSFLGGMFRLPEQAIVPSRYGTIRSGIVDSGVIDSGTVDSGTIRSGTVDSGTVDSGTIRSGFYRAGEEPSAEDMAAAAYDQDVRDQIPSPFAPGSPAEKSYFRREAARAPTEREVRVGVQNSLMQTPEAKAAIDMMDEGRRRKDPALVAQGQRTFEQLSEQAYREAIQEPKSGIKSIQTPPPATPPAENPPAAAAPTVPPPEDKTGAAAAKKPDEESGFGKRLSLRIDELKQEREASKSQRRENQLLALMQAGECFHQQAGFAAAAGKSSSALTNIAGGGAAGIATLADLEKTRRAEDASLRKEGLDLELAKERLIESSKERKSQRDTLAAQKEQSLLQSVTVNNRQEISSLNNMIQNENLKIASTPAMTETDKALIRSEIARLEGEKKVAQQQMYDVYDRMGLTRPKTLEQKGPPPGYNYVGQQK